MDKSRNLKQVALYSVEDGLKVTHLRGKCYTCHLEGQDTRTLRNAGRQHSVLDGTAGRCERQLTLLRAEISIVPRSEMPNNNFPGVIRAVGGRNVGGVSTSRC